jgi:hypothetical protein
MLGIESEHDVRSACYFLQERHVLERPWYERLDFSYWVEHLGRYDPADTEIASVITRLDDGGWEVGVHASLGSHRDLARLEDEKATIEEVVGHPVQGIRHHWLRMDGKRTWRRHRAAGFAYDTSLGSRHETGFEFGYQPRRPFDDEFLVFPLTVMDKVLVENTDDMAGARRRLTELFDEAAENEAVMTVLWHLRNFCTDDYPGQADLYRWLIDEALDRGAWVGPPGTLASQIRESPATH